MLTEEAHHLFVGETGVGRVVQRAAELSRRDPNGEAAAHGGIDLPVIQKYLNLWFSLCLDLFGGEVSSNAADYFAAGLKGRAHEAKYTDHVALVGARTLEVPDNGRMTGREVAERLAMNEAVRDQYIEDCQRAVDRWNKIIGKEGMEFRLRLPSRRFHRNIGVYAGSCFDPDGNLISEDGYRRGLRSWLPSDADRTHVRSLQARPVREPGQMAAWIAPPAKGINGRPGDFEYVRAEA